MQKISKEREAVESFLEALSSSTEMMDILGCSKIPEGDQRYILATKEEDILLDLAEISIEYYASPISKEIHISAYQGNLIHIGSGETALVIDPERLDTSIQKRIASAIKKNTGAADNLLHWLLIFSASAYPQVETCVRGISKVSSALTIARDYLRSLDQVRFDQIWYTNLMTRPVQVWPYSLGESLC